MEKTILTPGEFRRVMRYAQSEGYDPRACWLSPAGWARWLLCLPGLLR